MKLQPMLPSQSSHKLPVRIRLRPAQPVIEMNNREDETKLMPQPNQQSKQCNRINPPRNRNPNPVPGPQQLLLPNMLQHAFRQ